MNPKDLAPYFPKNYSVSKMHGVIMDLYSLLNSDTTYIPALIIEYVLFQIILKYLQYLRIFKLSTVVKIPDPDRTLILSAMQKSIDPEESLDDAMAFIEDMAYYPEFCFWDWDFKFLDEVTEDKLYHSDLNTLLGIGTEKSIIYIPGLINY